VNGACGGGEFVTTGFRLADAVLVVRALEEFLRDFK
jgi:hypothetical protein